MAVTNSGPSKSTRKEYRIPVLRRILVTLSLLTLYGIIHPFRHQQTVLLQTNPKAVRGMDGSLHSQPWLTGTKNFNPENRPRFILHVGLPKTGTTYLQCSLCSQFNVSEEVLLKDNWVYLGTCPYNTCGLAKCPDQFFRHSRASFFAYGTPLHAKLTGFGPILHVAENASSALQSRQPTTLHRDFTELVDKMRTRRRNVMVIFEGFHILDDKQIQALASFLKSDWDVQVLITYRPLYSWLPSKYNSVTKKQGALRRDWPSRTQDEVLTGQYSKPFALEDRGGFTEFVRKIEATQQHPAQICLHNFGLHFDNVSILALDRLPEYPPGVDSTLSYLFCSVARAPNACKAIRSKFFGINVANNPSVNYYNYDLLATAAYDSGILGATKLSRTQVRDSIQFQQELVLNRSVYDFPMKCLSEDTLNKLERMSLNSEKSLFKGSWTQRDVDAHHAGFSKTASLQQSYCWIDANRTLSDESWRSFFSSLEFRGKKNKQELRQMRTS